jgi:ketosteroid isomerase-like protein
MRRSQVDISDVDTAAAVIEHFYAAIEAGDVPTIVAYLGDDAIVSYPAEGALPYGGSWHGPEAIGRFLDLHDQAEEILEFEPARFAIDGEQVLVRGRFTGRSKATGRTWATNWVHAFDVVHGRVQRWEAYFDTAAAIEAHRPG